MRLRVNNVNRKLHVKIKMSKGSRCRAEQFEVYTSSYVSTIII